MAEFAKARGRVYVLVQDGFRTIPSQVARRMMEATLKIVCAGASAARRKRLTEILTRAGFDVSAMPAGARHLRGVQAGQLELVALRAGRSYDGSPSHISAARRPTSNKAAKVVVLIARPRRPSRASANDGKARVTRDRPASLVALNLRGLRETIGRTQADVARKASMSQPQLSRVEGRRDHLISTLRKYVRALGGDIEIVARVRGSRVLLRDI